MWLSRFLVVLIVFALSVSVEAQQPRNIPRIGFLSQAPVAGPNIEAFRQGLREHGYVDGKTIIATGADPVALGLAASLTHPGGNVHGDNELFD